MEETRTALTKIAKAFEAGAKPFAAENARLAALGRDVAPVETPAPLHELAPGVWLDFQAERGVVTTAGPAETGEGLRLQLFDRGDSPWYSLSYDLAPETLHDARYLGHFLCCDSDGPARFRVCLRHKLDEGFRDVFARDLVVLTGGEQEDLVFIRLDPDLIEQTRAAEVLFFFEGRSFDVTLRVIEAQKV